MAKFFNKPKGNIIAQIGAMKAKYPQMKPKPIDTESVSFEGNILIKPELPIYKIKIVYRGSLSPKVQVLEPKLVDNPPHYYKSTERICLYHPDDFKWHSQKLVAKEMMSWTIAWIYFYECWLQTGIWFGPESHHANTKKEDKNE